MTWMYRFCEQVATGTSQFYAYARRGWRGTIVQKRRADAQYAWQWLPTLSPTVETVSDLIRLYLASSLYLDLSASTKSSYGLYLRRIADKFGNLPIGALEERGARTVIRQWRDDALASQPRTADATMGVLRLLLNFALDEEYISRNPVANLGRLHTKTRRDVIWSDEQIARFLGKAPRHLARVLLLAVWTGQRQADLLSLEWKSYDGEYIRLQQRKASRTSSGRRVKVLVSKELRDVLEEIRLEQLARSQHVNPRQRRPQPDFILTTAKGDPWRRGFRSAWRKAVEVSGISGVTFHDLRGTFITLSHRAGATIREIAEASGHDEKECEWVIRQNYLATGAEQVISRLEKSKSFATDKWLAEGTYGRSPNGTEVRFTGPRRYRSAKRPKTSSGSVSGASSFGAWQ